METVKLYLPFTPSEKVSIKTFNAKELLMSCGGGMGGSKWEEYTTSPININEKFINIDTNLSKNEIINTSFIVKVTPIKIVELKIRNKGNHNLGKPSVGDISTYYFRINISDRVEFVDSYGTNPQPINAKNLC